MPSPTGGRPSWSVGPAACRRGRTGRARPSSPRTPSAAYLAPTRSRAACTTRRSTTSSFRSAVTRALARSSSRSRPCALRTSAARSVSWTRVSSSSRRGTSGKVRLPRVGHGGAHRVGSRGGHGGRGWPGRARPQPAEVEALAEGHHGALAGAELVQPRDHPHVEPAGGARGGAGGEHGGGRGQLAEQRLADHGGGVPGDWVVTGGGARVEVGGADPADVRVAAVVAAELLPLLVDRDDDTSAVEHRDAQDLGVLRGHRRQVPLGTSGHHQPHPRRGRGHRAVRPCVVRKPTTRAPSRCAVTATPGTGVGDPPGSGEVNRQCSPPL